MSYQHYLNTYNKTEVDTFLYTNYPSLSFTADNFYAKTEIDSTRSAYVYNLNSITY